MLFRTKTEQFPILLLAKYSKFNFTVLVCGLISIVESHKRYVSIVESHSDMIFVA